MGKYFTFDESPLYKNKYLIRFNLTKDLFPNGTKGSYAVLPARLLNLSYADYLRYARDRLGAELIGKNRKYVVAYYDKNQNTEAFIRLLNKRMEFIMNEKEFPFEYIEDNNGGIERIPFKINEDRS